jgi:hypothetical protein
MGFFANIIDALKKSARKRVHVDTKNKTLQLLFRSGDETYFTLAFDAMDVKSTNDEAVMQSYAIDAKNADLGNLYIETVRLKPLYCWYTAPKSAANLFVKRVYGNETTVVDSFSNDFFSLTKYGDAKGYEFVLLHFTLVTHDVFILDQKGKLSKDMLKIFNVTNDALLLKNPNPAPKKIPQSIVSLNLTERFLRKNSQ